jgi:hypothetical protein
LHFLIFPTCIGLIIREIFWIKNSCANILIIVFKYCSIDCTIYFSWMQGWKSVFIFHKFKHKTMTTSGTFIYSLNCWVNKPLLLIVTHNFVIKIGLKRFDHGFWCLQFHSELKHGLLQVQDIGIQRFYNLI